jgi:hypothetical protein
VSCIVVETNIPIVANGRPDPSNGGRLPSAACRLAAIDFLEVTLATRRVLLDLAGEIQAEYRRYLSPMGQPGGGDLFYLRMLMSAPERVERLDLPRNSSGAYEHFPDDPVLGGFDPSDRKFAAMARRAKAPVANATDTDWLYHNAALAANGIVVQFVCGRNSPEWFAP